MDCVSILLNQHKLMHELLRRLDGSNSGKSRQTLKEFSREYARNGSLIERYVYPALQNYDEVGSWLDGVVTNQETLGKQLEELRSFDDNRVAFKVAMTSFVSAMENHLRDQEHHIFPALRTLLPDAEFQALGDRMQKELHSQKAA